MTEEKFFKLLEKRLNLYEHWLTIKTRRLDNISENDTEADIYMDIAQLGSNYLNDIRIDLLQLDLQKTKTDNNTWFDPDAQYYYLDDKERTVMNVKLIDRGVVKLESESGSHKYHGSLQGINQLLSIVK